MAILCGNRQFCEGCGALVGAAEPACGCPLNRLEEIEAGSIHYVKKPGEWNHLATAPREREFLAHSRKWKRPRFIRRLTGGEYRSADGRKVIPEVWFDLPGYR